ncbi:hypothetical protein BG005_002255 [Podila minutissima]|nr:hypothetical protein BG005_002255 [Podila minutissima]
MIMANQDPYVTGSYHDPAHHINACYFPSTGLHRTFLEYLFNGATTSDINQDCLDVYKYIVQHYTPEHEIWMFSYSHGAYTMRCVTGMINNCSILSLGPEDHPKAIKVLEFKKHASYNMLTPVKSMGLMDTVGSLGVPSFDGGIGLTLPEFHDLRVSSVMEKSSQTMV